MKHTKFLAILLISSFFVSSCMKWDDQDYTTYYYNMATVTQGGEYPTFLLDDSVWLESDFKMPIDTFTVGERYFIYYTLGDTINHAPKVYPIALDYYAKSYKKEYKTLQHDTGDVWLNKPMYELKLIWFSSHYWNLMFTSYMGMSSPNTFELIRNKTLETAGVNDTIPVLNFELRHNVSATSDLRKDDQYYSFDLDSLRQEFPRAKKFKLFLKWNSQFLGIRKSENIYIPNIDN